MATISIQELEQQLAALRDADKGIHELPLVKVGNVLALISVDTRQAPSDAAVWHYDLDGRRANSQIQEVVTNVLKDVFNQVNPETHFHDVSRPDPRKQLAFLSGGAYETSHESRDIENARRHLRQAQEETAKLYQQRRPAIEQAAKVLEQKQAAKQSGWLKFFTRKPAASTQEPVSHNHPLKKP